MYLLIKVIHVIAVIVFVGNITTGVFWKAIADRTRDPRIIAHTLDGIIKSDRLFTTPAIVLVVLAGFGAAASGRFPILSTGWILWSLILIIISGAAFGVLAPAQRRLADLARKGVQSGELDWDRYANLSGAWALWGSVALITPLLAVFFMVLKPMLPAFHR